jgi:lysylphosphatidylglycerol synthetase-like protein (DUF2156 family)
MSSPDPYRPPQAPVADPERPRGAPVKGMVFGVLVDLGGSLAAALTLSFSYGIWLAASGMTAGDIEQALTQRDALSAFSLVGYTVGTAFSWLGGYVCARTARETELKCAGVVATVSCIAGLLLAMDEPLELNLALVLLTIGAVMLGGWMGKRQNERQP